MKATCYYNASLLRMFIESILFNIHLTGVTQVIQGAAGWQGDVYIHLSLPGLSTGTAEGETACNKEEKPKMQRMKVNFTFPLLNKTYQKHAPLKFDRSIITVNVIVHSLTPLHSTARNNTHLWRSDDIMPAWIWISPARALNNVTLCYVMMMLMLNLFPPSP